MQRGGGDHGQSNLLLPGDDVFGVCGGYRHHLLVVIYLHFYVEIRHFAVLMTSLLVFGGFAGVKLTLLDRLCWDGSKV